VWSYARRDLLCSRTLHHSYVGLQRHSAGKQLLQAGTSQEAMYTSSWSAAPLCPTHVPLGPPEQALFASAPYVSFPLFVESTITCTCNPFAIPLGHSASPPFGTGYQHTTTDVACPGMQLLLTCDSSSKHSRCLCNPLAICRPRPAGEAGTPVRCSRVAHFVLDA